MLVSTSRTALLSPLSRSVALRALAGAQPHRCGARRVERVASTATATWPTRRSFSVCARRHQAPTVESTTAPPPSQPLVGSSATSSSQEHPLVVPRDDESKVSVTWSSGIESRYHNVWLRDHCRCAECYHPQTKQRQVDTSSIPLDIKPQAVEATIEGMLVHWPRLGVNAEMDAAVAGAPSAAHTPDTAHASLYPWSWLYNNSYAPALGHVAAKNEAILWGSGIAQQPPTVTWDEVMSEESERGLAKWLSKIAQFGFCYVSGVPPTPEDTERLVRRIAFIRETHYGGFWDFTSDLSHGDTAYTNLALGAHTDTTYFTDPAGLQLFHLLSHTEATKDNSPAQGGASLLVDGFFAAKILRDVYPEAYTTLSRVRITTHSAGDDATLIRPLQSAGYPVLEHDEATGALLRVRYNNDDRSVLRVRDEDVVPLYDALNKWHGVLRHADSEYWAQLRPGMPMIFDNNRVLHGRSAFTGNRRLCGAYVNHDDYRSRLAVLMKKYPDLSGGAGGGGRGASEATQHARRGVWDDGL